MNFLDQFHNELAPKLGTRAITFSYMIQQILQMPHTQIIETGTARAQGNWMGDGQSTLIWDWIAKIKDLSVLSIDLNQDYIETARSQTTKVDYLQGDSVYILNKLSKDIVRNCGLLYLDSFDLDQRNPIPSAVHHLKELTAVWPLLPRGCMIVVDDCISDTLGKHIFVKSFFNSIEIKPVFTGYQWGWLKL